MPNRIIRECCRSSPTLEALSAEAERLFWRLTTVADDYGRFEADPRVLLATCFPLAVARLKTAAVERWFAELCASGAVVAYVVEGRQYGAFVAWAKHQRLRESKPKHPAPLETPAASGGELPRVAASCGELPLARTRARALDYECESSSVSSLRGESEGGEVPAATKRPTADEQARGLLDLVNATGGTHFAPVEANMRLIRGRLAEFDDWTLAAVVLRQWASWKAKPDMRPFFRPATLFGAEKCAQYVGQLTDTDRAWIQRKQAQGAAA